MLPRARSTAISFIGVPLWGRRCPLRPAASRAILHLLVCSTIAGCAGFAGPDYLRTGTPIKSGWSLTTSGASRGAEIIKLDWWKAFGDPFLNRLIEQAISNNISIQVAAAQIEEAGAGISSAEAARLPTVRGTAGLNTSFGEKTEKYEVSNSTASWKTNETKALFGAKLNWELDIWGKLRKGIEAQKASYEASEAEWRGVWLITVAAVTDNYFVIRQFDEQIDRQGTFLRTGKVILDIYHAQASEGLIGQTEVLTQQAEVNSLQTQLLDLQRERKLTENGIATLLGIPAGEFKVPEAALQKTVHIPHVPMGLPSDLLARRPDIIKAEYNVLAAHELVGQARLARLPTISLTGDANGMLSKALSTAVKMWTFGIGPSINIPIFDPNLKAQVKVHEAKTKTFEEQYRQTVILAFKEVEDALVNLFSHKAQRKEIESRVKHLELVAVQTRAQLKEGIVSQLQVLETERTLLEASLALLTNHREILGATISLYKALGGGWPPVTVAASPDK